MPLTFALFLQLAVIQQLNMATMDIKSAYLNVPLPPDADWIVTTLERHIAIACGIDPAQEYRIANALYGLPDSGRIFYLHYKNALLAEGYTMSAFDNCLFYRITQTETTYIIVYVDDTFIFSNQFSRTTSRTQHRWNRYNHPAKTTGQTVLTASTAQGNRPDSAPPLLSPAQRHRSNTSTRGPLCIPPLARHPTISHQKQTRYYGSSILRRHKKQQPHGPRSPGLILRRGISPCNTRCRPHPTQVHQPRTTHLLRRKDSYCETAVV